MLWGGRTPRVPLGRWYTSWGINEPPKASWPGHRRSRAWGPSRTESCAIRRRRSVRRNTPSRRRRHLSASPTDRRDRAHAVDDLVLVAVLRVDQVPPIANFKNVWHFEHGVEAGGPEVALELPVLEVLRRKVNEPASLEGFGGVVSLTRAQYEEVFLPVVIPYYERVAPVAPIVSWLRRELYCNARLFPRRIIIRAGLRCMSTWDVLPSRR